MPDSPRPMPAEAAVRDTTSVLPGSVTGRDPWCPSGGGRKGQTDGVRSGAGAEGKPMDDAEGAATFRASGVAYDNFMGRYSQQLTEPFAQWAGVRGTWRVLDVGCGPGALTGVLVRQAASVSACDPSPPFAEECAARNSDADVRVGRAEELPFGDGEFDAVLSQLVLHFVSDHDAAFAEFRRVIRPGGTIAACGWAADGGMEIIAKFWEAAVSVDPAAPAELDRMRPGGPGELVALFERAGLVNLSETTITVTSTYRDFDELWAGFLGGTGPVGAYCVGLADDERTAVRAALIDLLDAPTGEFALRGVARCARGSVE